jgi:FKBP-type peptidyl-prolyl cis-trans isomerase (trigger factor)
MRSLTPMHAFRNNAIAKLIEANAFEVPETLIENQSRNLLNNFARDLQQRGVDLNKVDNNFIEMAYSARCRRSRDVTFAERCCLKRSPKPRE